MLEESFIYGLCLLIWNKFKLFYNNSFLSRIFNGFFKFCIEVWNTSGIRHMLFNQTQAEHFFGTSAIGRGVNRIASFFALGKLTSLIRNSTIVTYVGTILTNALYMPVSGYGSLFLGFGSYVVLLRLLQGGMDGTLLLLAGTCIGLGLFLIVVNRSLAALYNGSFISRIFGQFFGLGKLAARNYPKNHFILFTFLGVLFGVVGVHFGMTMLVLAAGGLIGLCLVIYKTEIGVFVTAFLIPLMPTMYILGLVLLTVVSFFIKVLVTGEIKVQFGLLDFFLLLFAILLGYSVIISYYPKDSAIVAATYILFILFCFTVKNVIDDKGKLLAMISVITVSGGLVALYGIYQYVTGSAIITEAWVDSDMFEGMSTRIYSTLENPNILGEYLLFIIPLAFSMIYYFKEYINKLVGLGILAVTVVCMMLTLSRGAWLGLIFGMAVFVFLKDRRLLWFALIALLAMPFVLPDSIIQRFTSIGNMSDGSTSYRVNIWLGSLAMIADYWPIGIGLGTKTFMFIYRKYALNAIQAPHSHNLFLQLTIDMGVVGLFLFICIMAVFFKSFLTRMKETKDSFLTSVGAALCAGMVGYLLQGLTENVWYSYRVVIFFWLIIGLSGSYIKIMERKGGISSAGVR